MPLNLLVIASQRINYYELFAGQEVLGEAIIVEQCAWDDLRLCSHGGNGGLVASISPSTKPMPGTPQDRPRHMVPDMVLLRASCMGGPKVDWRPLLSTMIHSGVPTINSAFSFLVSQDRAAMYGRLLRVQKRLGGFKEFPLVPQSCYSDWRSATFPPDFPAVAKVGTASGGLGKMKIDDAAHWDDFCSVAAMQTQFFFSEPFIKWDFDIRIQKIGNHYRAFRRTSKHWKSNVDLNMKDEDMEVIPDRYIRWIEEASAECGMDISAIDVIRVDAEDKEYILELNSSAIGLNGRHHDEDTGFIRDLVLRRMEEEQKRKKNPPASYASSSSSSSSSSFSSGEAEEKAPETHQVKDLLSEVDQLTKRIQDLEKQLEAKAQEKDKPVKKKSWF